MTTLNPYLGMALDHAVLAYIDSMLKAKLVCHQSFWTFAESHYCERGWEFIVFRLFTMYCTLANSCIRTASTNCYRIFNANICTKINFNFVLSSCWNFRLDNHRIDSHVFILFP